MLPSMVHIVDDATEYIYYWKNLGNNVNVAKEASTLKYKLVKVKARRKMMTIFSLILST